MLKLHIKEKKPKKKSWKYDCRWRLTNKASQSTIQPIMSQTTTIHTNMYLNEKIPIICTLWMEFSLSFARPLSFAPITIHNKFTIDSFPFPFHFTPSMNATAVYWWWTHFKKYWIHLYCHFTTIAFLLSNVSMNSLYTCVYQWRHCLVLLSLLFIVHARKKLIQ